jgi:lipid A 3-O-deacylase
MKKKTGILIIIGVLLTCSLAMAESSGYGISFGYGPADSDIDVYRVGIKKDFWTQWFETRTGYLSGYVELSYNRWEHDKDDINAVAVSPVFVYYFGDRSNALRPYVEGGIGLCHISKTTIADRKMSTRFQFEDRIGVGIRWNFIDLNFRYMHYSNAEIKKPNHGIDMFLFTTSIQF